MSDSISLRYETVSTFMQQTLQTLMAAPALSSFQLAGGTSIALLTGHRHSVDLDLFTDQPFDPLAVAEVVTPLNPLSLKQTQIGIAYQLQAPIGESSLKIDLCNWRTAFLYSPVIIDNIRLTDLRDSCADKLNAVTDRQELKDIWDIAELLKHYTLSEMMGFYRQKHPFLSPKHPIQALRDFDYQVPVNFRVLNEETLESTRQRITAGLSQLNSISVSVKPLHIPEEYRQKLAQKGIDTLKSDEQKTVLTPRPNVPKRKGPSF